MSEEKMPAQPSAAAQPAPPRQGLRERKKQQTRDSIATTALRLFLDHGFDQVTVAEVAGAVDVSVKTVFNYFRTKEDLFFDEDGTQEQRLVAAIKNRAVGESALHALRGYLLQEVLNEPDPSDEEVKRYLKVLHSSPALVAKEREITAHYQQVLTRVLAEETGRDPGDIEPQVAAAALFGTVRTLAQQRSVDNPPSREEVLAAIEQAMSMLGTGLAGYAVKEP